MHLYVHVPFCARRCTYCDFAIAVRREVPSAAFADAVIAEWDRRSAEWPWAEAGGLDTVYFGGGTPSHVAPASIAAMLERFRRDRPFAPGAEITLEANPDDVTPARAAEWAAAGINRVSLGVQSFDPRVLRWMHRTHLAEQVEPAVAALREAGIGRLSLDLIYALPSGLARDWPADLERALALDPGHLSFYGLTVEPRTPLARAIERGEIGPAGEEAYAAEFLATHRRLADAGYQHYEVSSAARPGHRAEHNSAYWRRATYLGLGPSAHSGHGDQRWWNVREWTAWDRAVREGNPVAGHERLDPAARRLEELYLGLRTIEGVSADLLDPAEAATWESRGWAERSGPRVRLTPEGWLRLDALVARG